MRVLFVTPRFPEDPARNVSGAFQRMRAWLDAIRSTDAELELLVFTPAGADTSAANAARVARELASEWGVRAEVVLCPRDERARTRGLLAGQLLPLFSLSGHPEFAPFAGKQQQQALAAALSRSPDVLLFHTLFAAATPWASAGRARILFDLDDIQHRRFMREITQPPRRKLKPLRRLWMPAMWWCERAAIVRSERASVCSEGDRDYLQRTMGVHNVGVIPNATARVEDRPPSPEPNVMFVGTYDYPPNRVAAEYLVGEIWPHVSRLRPEARLLIAGPHAEQIPAFRAPPAGVEFLGFVPDMTALYDRTRVFCCPIQSGGGTRVKILEAAGHGVPVVSTPVGAEGIELAPEREILLRESAADLAEACAALLADPERAQRLGALGRDRVRVLYGRERVVERMRAMLTGGAPATTAG
jgi:glycosyltransferase involved in cell wall biosynthesis